MSMEHIRTSYGVPAMRALIFTFLGQAAGLDPGLSRDKPQLEIDAQAKGED